MIIKITDYAICTDFSTAVSGCNMSVLAKLVVVLLLLAVSNAGQQQPNCDRDPDAQVLILGAGMAGLGAARNSVRVELPTFSY